MIGISSEELVKKAFELMEKTNRRVMLMRKKVYVSNLEHKENGGHRKGKNDPATLSRHHQHPLPRLTQLIPRNHLR